MPNSTAQSRCPPGLTDAGNRGAWRLACGWAFLLLTVTGGDAIGAQSTGETPITSSPPAVGPQAPDPALGGLEILIRQTAERLAAANAMPELTGSGPYPALLEADLALPDATIYRPAALNKLGKRKLAVLIWGNGGCSNDGASAHTHLAEIASHGYLVIAPGKPLTGPTATAGMPKPQLMKTTIQDLRMALDWALTENSRAGSPLVGLIDTRAVAAAGHSCGGMLAILLGDDPRIQTVIVHNSGIFPVLPDNPPLVMHEERIDGLRRPVLFVLGGQSDVAWRFGQDAFSKITTTLAVLVSRDLGHNGTFSEPHGGEVAKLSVDWLQWQLRGDKNTARTFVGPECRLCSDSHWTIQKKNVR